MKPICFSFAVCLLMFSNTQEQELLSAPLIIYDPEDPKIADQEVILLLVDSRSL